MLKFHFLSPISIYEGNFLCFIRLSYFTIGKMHICGSTTDKGKMFASYIQKNLSLLPSFNLFYTVNIVSKITSNIV